MIKKSLPLLQTQILFMADTATESKASVKKNVSFGTQKQPDSIIYRLIKQNAKIREDTPLYPPYKRFPNYDLITWEGGTRAIRWLPGFTSIFVDEQEAGNRVIPDNILNNPNNRFEIIEGIIRVRPHEKTKIQFLDLCNRNADSKHRTGSVEALFARVSEEKTIKELGDKQQAQKIAIEKAFNASAEQIAFHAKYLGIPMTDAENASRTFEAVQADYRQIAIDNPVSFLKTFDDEDLKLKYKIEKALESNFINLTIVKGKAVFTSNKVEICEVPENVESKVVVDTIFNFSQSKNGTAFLKQLADFDK
jgi:hypothetical protein